MHDSTIPADLLELKARLEAWRKNRQYQREPIPDEFRQAATEMTRRYSPALVRRVLKLDPWRLRERTAKPSERKSTGKKPQAVFFKLPTESAIQGLASAPQSAANCRLQLERADGSRLILTLSGLDLASTRQLCADFLRG
jgi:hypothetical protein